MDYVQFQLPWPPSGNNRNGFARGKVYRKRHTQKYFDDVYYIAKSEKIPLTSGLVEIHIHFCPPNRRRCDEDNLKKVLYDSIVAAQIIEDDSMIKSGAFTFDENVTKGGMVMIRIRPHFKKDPFFYWQ